MKKVKVWVKGILYLFFFFKKKYFQVWTEEGEEESEMTCSERLQVISSQSLLFF